LHIFQSPQKRNRPSGFLLWSPYIEKDVPSPEPSLHIFKVPRKEAPLQVPFSEPHRNRCSVPRTLLYLSLAVPGERTPPPSRFPLRAPMERDAHHQGLLYIPLKIPNKGTSLQAPLETLQREMHITRAFYTCHLYSPVKDPPFQVPLSEPP
jgi:hypothetical protein